MPSCSTFQGRSGSSEWTVRTLGMPHSFEAITPPMSVYQVWQWTRSASSVSLAMARERAKASMAPTKRGSVPRLVSSHCG